MLTWTQPPKLEALAFYMLLGICVVGGLSSFAMFGVMLRQLNWIGRQLDLVYKLQSQLNVEVHVTRKRAGFLQTTFVIVMGIAALAAWTGVAVLIVHGKS